MKMSNNARDYEFQKILVPIDGSEHSLKALDYALEFASRYVADLHVLSVFSLTEETFHLIQRVTPRTFSESYRQDVKEKKEQIVTEAVKHAQSLRPHLTITQSIVQGRPADQIVKVAKELNIDLIIMGSRGIGGIKSMLLGSVADRVADHASCPVMIVK
jgi:nucleotide-binding universal stress UspA family protein